MRDIVLFLLIFGSLPFCFIRPWIGILVFSWISYMNPHKFTWGAAYDFPFAKIVALVTIIGLLLTRDKMPLPKTRETLLIILLGIYFTFTNFFAFYPEAAWEQWEKVIKILIMTLVTIILINDKIKLKYLIMVIAFSIGILGIKGGIFSFVTGGEFRVYGPAESFIADNNDMALALNMTLPFLFYLAKDKQNIKLNKLTWFMLIMCIISIIFTYSRGGLVTLVAVGTLLFFKFRYKIILFPILSLSVLLMTSYIPEQWFGRMETIKTYEESHTAMARIYAWQTAWNVAKDKPFYGSGFEGLQRMTRFKYSPKPFLTAPDVHSVYFEVLGEHGFVAFIFFIALILYSFSTIRNLKNSVKNRSGLSWIENYANMFQISLIAYMVGGIFLGRAYFDLFYHIVAMVVILRVITENELSREQEKKTVI